MTQPLIHGGDWAGFEAQYGRPPLDFSANVSPLGLPEAVRQAVEASLPHADRYPDPLCRALTGALAQAEGLPEAWLLCVWCWPCARPERWCAPPPLPNMARR